MSTLTAEERAAIRRDHVVHPNTNLPFRGTCWHCNGWDEIDLVQWPCPTLRMLDALEAAEAEIAALRTSYGADIERGIQNADATNAAFKRMQRLIEQGPHCESCGAQRPTLNGRCWECSDPPLVINPLGS